MFVPKVARAQAKSSAIPTDKLAPRRRTLAAQPSGSHREQEAGPASLTDPGTTLARSWDFSQMPIFPPDRANRPQASSPSAELAMAGKVQPKLAIGRVDDPLEQEADRVADRVMRTPNPELSITAEPAKLSRKCDACEAEENVRSLQPKTAGSAGPVASEAPPSVHEVLRSSGEPLDAPTRAFFEPRFGHDLSRVRTHTGPQADRSAREVNSIAYTVGRNIVFAAQRYAPSTPDGARLLAHELTHVLQQQGTDRLGLSADKSAVGHLQRQDDGTDDVTTGGDQTADPAFVPAPLFPPTPADAWICGRPLNYPILGLAVGHSYVKSPPANYGIVKPLCTPTDGGSDNLVMGTAAYKRDDSCDPGALTPVCTACHPKPGVADVKKCLRDAFDGYNAPTMHKATGPNSNTLAGTLARACCAGMGNDPPFPGTFPGWGDPAAPTRPATCPTGPPDCS